ncbi:hypothetical protein VFC49_05040 [Thermococcus sp. SY098]|uniref:hypothetical protein n=1 Tax=Thermococcus sp. SY098 TaxID=3111325 RepID=UPI002D765E02|nr:hypothetical protein [Thermococcus sp. SY098]WRS53470.1 hypothetical protein VFC49_05040 [Thermococcus sp. SY098]
MVIMKIKLPAPKREGRMSLEEAVDRRKSIRRYKDEPPTLKGKSLYIFLLGIPEG